MEPLSSSLFKAAPPPTNSGNVTCIRTERDGARERQNEPSKSTGKAPTDTPTRVLLLIQGKAMRQLWARERARLDKCSSLQQNWGFSLDCRENRSVSTIVQEEWGREREWAIVGRVGRLCAMKEVFYMDWMYVLPRTPCVLWLMSWNYKTWDNLINSLMGMEQMICLRFKRLLLSMWRPASQPASPPQNTPPHVNDADGLFISHRVCT